MSFVQLVVPRHRKMEKLAVERLARFLSKTWVVFWPESTASYITPSKASTADWSKQNDIRLLTAIRLTKVSGALVEASANAFDFTTSPLLAHTIQVQYLVDRRSSYI